MAKLTRRSVIAGLTAASVSPWRASARETWDVIVVGAGVFGAWTAEKLRREGQRVLLIDAWGPGNTRATSGGESRMTRGGYGADSVYTEMSLQSLEDWKRLSADASLPLFHNVGVLAFFGGPNDYASESYATMSELNIPVEQLGRDDLAKRWPQVNWSDIEFGLHEPSFGALMARRSVAQLVKTFTDNGGTYRQAEILPSKGDGPIEQLRTRSGETLEAGAYVFACGPWLTKLFPNLLGNRLFVTKQEVFYFRPSAGDSRFAPAALPGWADFSGNSILYGFPDLESRGFKIANDGHGPRINPDANDRLPDAAGLAEVRDYMAMRFPGLNGAPLSEARVCQYENSANGDFLIDRHPNSPNTVLVGMGSGHGFKHGPAVGAHAAALVLGDNPPHERFSLETKATRQQRAVH